MVTAGATECPASHWKIYLEVTCAINFILPILRWLFSFSVATNVLKQNHLKLNGYRLQLKEQQPELFLPLDRKKLYIENIEPSTTKDGLSNYIEVVTKLDVSDLQFGTGGGNSRNALATFHEEPGNVIK